MDVLETWQADLPHPSRDLVRQLAGYIRRHWTRARLDDPQFQVYSPRLNAEETFLDILKEGSHISSSTAKSTPRFMASTSRTLIGCSRTLRWYSA